MQLFFSPVKICSESLLTVLVKQGKKIFERTALGQLIYLAKHKDLDFILFCFGDEKVTSDEPCHLHITSCEVPRRKRLN